ncbi:MAG: Dabb family protein [Alphaproteobacteria bacterium]|nr:Dabb family protein [Alphaproteobacteria bacterium]
MIRHIVLFSAKNLADVAVIETALAKLGSIPESRFFEVARNSKRDGLSQEIDIIVYSEFDSFEALERYKQHTFYAEAIAIVRPLRDVRIAVDFESKK